jgi:phosphoribosylglycinamide formyltransferase-1
LNDSNTMPSAAVLISGGGSNLQALIDATQAETLEMSIAAVLSNVPDAYGLQRAEAAGIPTECVQNKDFPEREEFDAAVARVLDGYQPDLLILAGFMRILSAGFVNRFAGRIINIHPSLLPKYPGLHTHRRALDAGDVWHGATVHFVTEELDAGPLIIQGRVPVQKDDDAGTLAARVLQIEHLIYPEAARLFAAGRLALCDGCSYLDGELLTDPIQFNSPRQP